MHCGLWRSWARKLWEFARPSRPNRICSNYCSRTNNYDWLSGSTHSIMEGGTSSPRRILADYLRMLVSYSRYNRRRETDDHQATLSAVYKAAWAEHPGLAVQLVTRFQSQKLTNDVRWLLLNFPEMAIGEPDALQILIGSSMSKDLSFQLKVSLAGTAHHPGLIHYSIYFIGLL